MLTLGIDLASQPRRTGVCAIQWGNGGGEVVLLAVGEHNGTELHDEWLATTAVGLRGLPAADKVAIDAPFGWPSLFVDAVCNSASGEWPLDIDFDRSMLERRETDRHVWRRTGKLPLSVSTDKIAYTAMRCAALLNWWGRRQQRPVDRVGRGLVCEAYPDPLFRLLLERPVGKVPSYKGKGEAAIDRRRIILRQLAEGFAGRLVLTNVQRSACETSDDALDAIACALVGRAAALNLTELPGPEQEQSAEREGWIHLPAPDVALAGLIDG